MDYDYERCKYSLPVALILKIKDEPVVEEMDEEDGHPAKKRRLDQSGEIVAETTTTVEHMDEDRSEEESVHSLFAHHTENMLEWIWITWIPELLAKLDQVNGKAYKVCLSYALF